MWNILVAFALGFVSSTVIARSSHRFGRELDAATRLAGAYRRSLAHLRAYRRTGMGRDFDADQAHANLDAYRSAELDVQVEWSNLEMLIGRSERIEPIRREMIDCGERVHDLVTYFAADPQLAERRLAFDDTDTASGEIAPRLERVERFLDILIATYRDRARLFPWLGRSRRKLIASAVEELGQPPRYGHRVNTPVSVPLP
jgi:hypothetical protein